MEYNQLRKQEFGKDFKWGVSTSAFQIEGAYNAEGKGYSIWDVFSKEKNRIFSNHTANTAADFYNKHSSDLQLMKFLNIPNLRFSISWPRILPHGSGQINIKGIDFYNRLIDKCLELEIEPWVTLYHWDLPYDLERKGGWTNRKIIDWFSNYAVICAKSFGDRVKHWMVLNEPLVFTGAGYFLGIHAPGRKWLSNFLPAVHHAVLCQAMGGRILKELIPDAEIGTTFSCSHIEPASGALKDRRASNKMDALLNRLFIEPSLGLGYPYEALPFFKKIEKYVRPEDEKLMPFDFDFIGLQNYTREIVRHSWLTPFLNAKIIPAKERNVPVTAMDWEIYPESIYHILKKFSFYNGVNKIYITENGAAFKDKVLHQKIDDQKRVAYIQDHLKEVLRARNEGVKVEGYFIWSLLDNFEWTKGYAPRFGLVYVNFDNQSRYIKSSGYWYKSFLENKNKNQVILHEEKIQV